MVASGPRTGKSPCGLAMGELGIPPKPAAQASSAAAEDGAAALWGDPSHVDHFTKGWVSRPSRGDLLSLAIDWFRFWFGSGI